MKRIAYYALHYGKEYLAWSIRSIQDAVDEIHVLYSDRPSFGYNTSLTCPDTEEELKKEAYRFLQKPLFWHQGHWNGEGVHRNEILKIAKERSVDQILTVDADELWAPEAVKEALEISAKRHERTVLVRFIHFWRSLGWVCKDPCMPVRIINLNGDGLWYLSPQEYPVLHFGYAQDPTLVRYKESIHGHKGEWRAMWFENKFLVWTPRNEIGDVHPTNVNFWTPEAVDTQTGILIGKLLYDHPYLNKKLIE